MKSNLALGMMKHFSGLLALIGRHNWKSLPTTSGHGRRANHALGTACAGRIARVRSGTCTTKDVEKVLAARSRRTMRGRKRSNYHRCSQFENPTVVFKDAWQRTTNKSFEDYIS